MRCLMIVFLFCVAIAVRSEAGLVERDLFALGDGLLTYDEVNQREWLDLTETFGWDLSTLNAALSSEGVLCSFSVATLADLEGLANTAGVSWIAPWQYPGATGNEANHLIELVGPFPTNHGNQSAEIPTRIPPGTDYGDIVHIPMGPFGPLEGSIGFIADDDGAISETAVVIIGSGNLAPGQINVPIFFQPSGGIFAHEFELDSVAGPYWLYRTVPEPNSLLLLLIFAAMRVPARHTGS